MIRKTFVMQLNRGIYRAHPEIQAIVNALPLNGTAFCVSDFPLDTRTILESYLFLPEVIQELLGAFPGL